MSYGLWICNRLLYGVGKPHFISCCVQAWHAEKKSIANHFVSKTSYFAPLITLCRLETPLAAVAKGAGARRAFIFIQDDFS